MSDVKQLAERFLQALTDNRTQGYESILAEDASLLIAGWDGSEHYRPRQRVIARLMQEWSAWPDPLLQSFALLADGEIASVEFRIQATEHERYVEHNRSAFLDIHDEKIQQIRIYCPEPLPSARRQGWIAPDGLGDAELQRLFESMMHLGDPREWIPPETSGRYGLRGGTEGGGGAHPSGNFVGAVRWTVEEADRRIEETIAYHRAHGMGFQWSVSPYDTPADLGARLERHGLALAGDAATMARADLDQLDIPTNPSVTVAVADPRASVDIAAMAQLLHVCFNWPQEQVDRFVPGMLERMLDDRFRQREVTYLARLADQPVAFGRLQLQGGVAYLGGAATLPQARGRKVYSTLLRYRLEQARHRGYHLAAITAEPMSRRIVAQYGFKEYARIYLYAWMPVMDLEVIRSLVPQ